MKTALSENLVLLPCSNKLKTQSTFLFEAVCIGRIFSRKTGLLLRWNTVNVTNKIYIIIKYATHRIRAPCECFTFLNYNVTRQKATNLTVRH